MGFIFIADNLDDRDAVNEFGCLLADQIQVLWPEGRPKDPKNQQEILIFNLAQACHTLIVARVRELEARKREKK